MTCSGSFIPMTRARQAMRIRWIHAVHTTNATSPEIRTAYAIPLKARLLPDAKRRSGP